MSESNENLDAPDAPDALDAQDAPLDRDRPPADNQHPPDAPRKKRNCGKTGATSIAGRRRCALNALKHGACSGTHLLNSESEDEWLLLLHQWRESYAPPEALDPCPSGDPQPPALSDCECPSCLFDRSPICALVLKVAEAEWYRRRSQRALNSFILATGSGPNINWTAEQHKAYSLFRRYKTTDERTFHREFRELQEYVKTHPTPPEPKPRSKPKSEPQPEPASGSEPVISVIVPHPNSPTGFFCMQENPPRPGVVYPYPVPRPPDFPGPRPPEPPADPKPTDDSETG